MAALGRWDLSLSFEKDAAFAICSLRSEVLIGKTAEDNDRLSLQYGKPDEALSARTSAYRHFPMRVLMDGLNGGLIG